MEHKMKAFTDKISIYHKNSFYTTMLNFMRAKHYITFNSISDGSIIEFTIFYLYYSDQ
jgi:hypothetical protein